MSLGWISKNLSPTSKDRVAHPRLIYSQKIIASFPAIFWKGCHSRTLRLISCINGCSSLPSLATAGSLSSMNSAVLPVPAAGLRWSRGIMATIRWDRRHNTLARRCARNVSACTTPGLSTSSTGSAPADISEMDERRRHCLQLYSAIASERALSGVIIYGYHTFRPIPTRHVAYAYPASIERRLAADLAYLRPDRNGGRDLCVS